MASKGLSLVGFLSDHNQALHHLKNPCVPTPGKTDPDLLQEWSLAKVKSGAVIANAGQPSMTQIPITHPYVSMLMNSSPYQIALQDVVAKGGSFQSIEIDPLLAFQVTVDKERSIQHCSNISNPPTETELMAICLPALQSQDVYHASGQGTSIVIRSRSLNLRVVQQGDLRPLNNAIGIRLDWSMPLVHVVRFQGRCYLHNGYHRAFGVRMGGATHMPCLFRDVLLPEEVGAGNGHFDMSLLQSPNPPTMTHFTNGRAWDVDLRTASRIIQINWSDHILYEE